MRRHGSSRRRWVFVLVVLLLVAAGWYRLSLQPLDPADPRMRTVTVERGMGVSDIAEALDAAGVLRSTLAFRIYVVHQGMQSDLKAGSYALSAAQGVAELARTLSEGTVDDVMVTIPEGYTVRDIDALLAKRGIAQPGAIEACARTCDFSAFEFLPPDRADLAERGGRVEGYLFPDTYNVRVSGFDAQVFLHRMLANFRTKALTPLQAEISASQRSLRDIVIMASLIEEETRTDDERAVVSGILWKRLDIGMILGVDAAVRYVVDSGKLTAVELAVDSPYNIRRLRGLTPGPIANPGLQSLRAALDPSPSPYLYYLHDPQGRIHYATTNDEHNSNKQRYL